MTFSPWKTVGLPRMTRAQILLLKSSNTVVSVQVGLFLRKYNKDAESIDLANNLAD